MLLRTMSKVEYVRVPPAERRKMAQELAKFLLKVKDEKEMIQILNRLLTPSEIVMLGRRLRVAEELLRGKSYENIRGKLKVGFTTIKSVEA